MMANTTAEGARNNGTSSGFTVFFSAIGDLESYNLNTK